MPDDAARALADLPLFKNLEGPEELAEIAALVRPFSVRAGSTLFRQSDEADGLYVFSEGQATVHARIPGDTLRMIGVLGPGAMVGEVGLIDREARSATVEARTDLSGWFLGERDFRALRAARRPSARKVMEGICRVVCERIRNRKAEVAHATPLPAPPWGASSPRPEAFPPPLRSQAIAPPTLAALPFFARLGNEARADLLQLGRTIEAPRGRSLWQPGDPPASCYVPLRGALQISVGRAVGGWETLFVLGPGRLAGIVGLLDGLAQSTRCQVLEPAWLFETSVADLRSLVLGSSPLGAELFDHIAVSLVDRLRGLTRTVARLTAQGRIRPPA